MEHFNGFQGGVSMAQTARKEAEANIFGIQRTGLVHTPYFSLQNRRFAHHQLETGSSLPQDVECFTTWHHKSQA